MFEERIDGQRCPLCSRKAIVQYYNKYNKKNVTWTKHLFYILSKINEEVLNQTCTNNRP